MKAHSVGTFVQIGDMAINMAQVVKVDFKPLGAEGVYLYFSRQRGNIPIVLRDDERVAFLEWWERQAELATLSPFRIPTPSTCCPSTYWIDLGAKRAGPG